jgi:hypothetical protein
VFQYHSHRDNRHHSRFFRYQARNLHLAAHSEVASTSLQDIPEHFLQQFVPLRRP